MNNIKLTKFSSGGGCGCKISPIQLEKILSSDMEEFLSPNLLVGNRSKDDAAIFKFDEKYALVSTTDFFTPIVDDPYTFGRIAATNAISDVYAMGGTPLMAISILGWPLKTLNEQIAKLVIEGAKSICNDALITLAGGHSIDITEPIFGLAVTGKVELSNIKRNDTARSNSTIYLTKPLGIGIISAAIKKGIASSVHEQTAINLMCTLNKAGADFGKLQYVSAMTDVTGFGLLGHLIEICLGSNLQATINFSKLPLVENLDEYLKQDCFPGGTGRNYASYKDNCSEITEHQKRIICDPQTSGGLLVVVDNNHTNDFKNVCDNLNVPIFEIGNLLARTQNNYTVCIK